MTTTQYCPDDYCSSSFPEKALNSFERLSAGRFREPGIEHYHIRAGQQDNRCGSDAGDRDRPRSHCCRFRSPRSTESVHADGRHHTPDRLIWPLQRYVPQRCLRSAASRSETSQIIQYAIWTSQARLTAPAIQIVAPTPASHRVSHVATIGHHRDGHVITELSGLHYDENATGRSTGKPIISAP